MGEMLRNVSGLAPYEILLWGVLAIVTGLAVTFLLKPVASRPGREAAGTNEGARDMAERMGSASDAGALAIYRDQLAEIERDRVRGVLGLEEAEAAHAEVSRRLLAEADRVEASQARKGGSTWRRPVSMAVLIGLPLLTLSLYLALGAPNVPDQPLAARLDLPPEQLPVEGLVAKVEHRLRDNPEDLRGWQVIAPIYMEANRFDDAVRAYRQVLVLGGATASRYADYGEALTLENQGDVGPDAVQAFEAALAADPSQTKAEYYLGLQALQNGQRDEAAKRWRHALEQAPADSPARPWLAAQLRELQVQEQAVSGASSASSASAPTAPSSAAPAIGAEQRASMAALSPEERMQAISSMVEGLADRLSEQPEDLTGWLRLIRAYGVLGQENKANSALKTARDVFRDDPEALALLEGATAPAE